MLAICRVLTHASHMMAGFFTVFLLVLLVSSQ